MAIPDLQQLLRYIYAERINQVFNSLVKERCVGCEYDHPSQKQHLCMDPESDSLAPVLFEIAAERVDKFDLRLMFIEAAKNMFLDYRHINFQQYLKELESYWRHTEWKNLEESNKVPEHVVLAVLSARMKLLVLEKRIHA